MFKTPLSEIRAPRPLRQQTTSTADTTSFLSDGKVRGAGGRAGVVVVMVVVAGMEPSTPSTAYARHFRVSCHACVEGLSLPSPSTLLFLIEFSVSM